MHSQAGGFKVLSQRQGQNQGTRVQRPEGQAEAENRKNRRGPGFWQAGMEMSSCVFCFFLIYQKNSELRCQSKNLTEKSVYKVKFSSQHIITKLARSSQWFRTKSNLSQVQSAVLLLLLLLGFFICFLLEYNCFTTLC